MKLKKEYKDVLSFKSSNNKLFILETDRSRSFIRKIDESKDVIVWQRGFEQYIYEFALLGNKIYATTGKAPQKTLVLSRSSGEILDENFKAVLHLPLFSKSNKNFICFATYNGKNIDLRFTKDLVELEVVNSKDVNVSRRLDENYFLKIQKEIIQLYDYEKSNIVLQFNLSEIISKSYPLSLELKPKVYNVELKRNTIVLGVIDLKNYNGYLFGISLKSGLVEWYHQGYSNFEIYGNKLYNMEFYGKYRVLNPENGKIEQEADLKEEFVRKDINCEHRFNVTDTHIYFKHAIQGKFGILNLKTLKIEEMQQLPEGNTMSTDEYPNPVGNLLYVRSAPQNNLFVYEM